MRITMKEDRIMVLKSLRVNVNMSLKELDALLRPKTLEASPNSIEYRSIESVENDFIHLWEKIDRKIKEEEEK